MVDVGNDAEVPDSVHTELGQVNVLLFKKNGEVSSQQMTPMTVRLIRQ